MFELLPQPTPLSYTFLELYDRDGNLLRSDYALPPVDNSKRVRNVKPMQPAGSYIQGYKGDGIFTLDEIHVKALVILPAGIDRTTAEHQYEQDALQAYKIKVGNYAQWMAAYKGIDNVSALAQMNKTHYTIEWIYLPRTYYWTDESSVVSFGTGGSQDDYVISAHYINGSWTFSATPDLIGKVARFTIDQTGYYETQIIDVPDAQHMFVDRPQTVGLSGMKILDTISRVL